MVGPVPWLPCFVGAVPQTLRRRVGQRLRRKLGRILKQEEFEQARAAPDCARGRRSVDY